jgi:hypothetical protein
MKIDYVSEIQAVEAEIKEHELPNDIALIKQTFIVWYLLVEGSNEVEEDYLQQILNRNITLINKFHQKNPELLFLKGWMIGISPWFFDSESDEIGDKYLRLAFKYRPDNLLFKWALRKELDTSKNATERLEALVIENLDKYYINYRPIQEYFENVVGRR